ncbi:MAG: hypothetical protein ACRCYY_17480 [Trueperaceae bacterium]
MVDSGWSTMHRLKRTHQPPFEFQGWVFYDSANKYSSSRLRKDLEGYVKLYITDLSWVVLECVKFDKEQSTHVVRVLETIEDALDELALQPLTVVSAQLYKEVMQDMTALARV